MTKSNKTFTAVTRDYNTWTQFSDGSVEYPTTWTCGHKHRTIDAAQKCLDKMGNAACSYRAEIEDSNGKRVDSPDYN
jgi:hypothetical protein